MVSGLFRDVGIDTLICSFWDFSSYLYLVTFFLAPVAHRLNQGLQSCDILILPSHLHLLNLLTEKDIVSLAVWVPWGIVSTGRAAWRVRAPHWWVVFQNSNLVSLSILQFVVHILGQKVLSTLSSWSIPSWLPSAEDVAIAILESFLLWALERGDGLLGPALSCPATLTDKHIVALMENFMFFILSLFPLMKNCIQAFFALLLVLHVKMVLNSLLALLWVATIWKE